MTIRFYNNKPLFVSGKPAWSDDCCCGWNDTDTGSPPPPPESCSDCLLASPTTGTASISGIPFDLGHIDHITNCVSPYPDTNELYYDDMNGSYALTNIIGDYGNAYGECYVGTWQDTGDPGILVQRDTSCFSPYPVTQEIYLWKVRAWWEACYQACGTGKREGLMTLEMLVQYWNGGLGGSHGGGYTIYYDVCNSACLDEDDTNCHGGSCSIFYDDDTDWTASITIDFED